MIAASSPRSIVLALALGLPAVYLRGRALARAARCGGAAAALRRGQRVGRRRRALAADGLLRAFGGLEKGSAFYLGSRFFWLKMALFALILALEIRPMVTFIRWRAGLRRGRPPDTSGARALYRVNHVEMALVVLMVFVAAFMARGFGAG